ncbi:MAG: putative membrane protein, partial [Patiriisocius sp.]
METAAILIYIHAGFGGLALIFGSLAIVFKKGSKKHRASGKYFFHSMIISAVIALLIACLPGHHSPFLFSIGLFSLYFLITGYSALRFKKKIDRVTIDIIGNISMLVIASCMVLLPLIIYGV